MKPFDITACSFNPFHKIGTEWMLVTAGDENGCNTMTASWGGLGILWHKNVAFVFVRPQRYTKTFMDTNEFFTLSFYNEQYRNILNFCGSQSGRDCDKIKQAGLDPVYLDGTVTFDQADITLVCKKLYVQELSEDCALTHEVTKHYVGDYHTMYVAEITKAYQK